MRISQGRSGRPSRFALRALEVPVGLQEGLLGQVLGVVMVADAVVGVAVHVAQMRPVEIGELGVELRLGLLADVLGHSLHPTPCRRPARRRARSRVRVVCSPDSARAARRRRRATPTAAARRPRSVRSPRRRAPASSARRSGSAAGARHAGAPCAGGSASRVAPRRCRSPRSARPARRFRARDGRCPVGGRRAGRRRTRVPSGKTTTQSPRSRIARAVAIASPSPAPRSTGKAPSALRIQACQRFSNSSRLAM